ncbi:MAG: 2'-deoxycytidine 5'-triphosphate deaminase [Pseudomonadota bacterium]
MMSEAPGILSDRMIANLYDQGAVLSTKPLDADQIQPASLDLRLGDKAYRVRASFLPGAASSVSEKLQRHTLHEFDLSEGAVLETGCVYIVPLLESLNLDSDTSASTNPKSSTGRLDIFTRVITDRSPQFDTITSGYSGPLYLEISPRTFPIIVRTGSRLAQLRLRTGECSIGQAGLVELQAREILVDTQHPEISRGGIGLSIDLAGEEGELVGYRGKRHTAVVDVDKPNSYNVEAFWEPIIQVGSKQLVLDPDQFYILVSQEAVHVPPDYAAEMVPFDPLVGEFRVHYAGFFDPGFGHSSAGGTGSKAVLEVRSHEVPFLLEHGQIVGRLVYETMLERPKKLYGSDLGSHYQKQGLKLSKHFRSASQD